MTYRDELRALRARKETLEAEVEALKRQRQEQASALDELEARRREIAQLNEKLVRLEVRLGERPRASARPALLVALLCLIGAGGAALLLMLRRSREAPPPVEPEPPRPPAPPVVAASNISGTVHFRGEALPMEVPRKRKESELCRSKDIEHNALLVDNGKLRDVWVGIANRQVAGARRTEGTVTFDQRDCNYAPRIAAAMTGQAVAFSNGDATMHNVNAKLDGRVQFNMAMPKGSPPFTKVFEEPGIYRIACDLHEWMRAFVVVSDNPYAAVTGADGTYALRGVPDGKYKVVAWHSFFGAKEQVVELRDGHVTVDGGPVTVDFEYFGDEDEPLENRGELDELF